MTMTVFQVLMIGMVVISLLVVYWLFEELKKRDKQALDLVSSNEGLLQKLSYMSTHIKSVGRRNRNSLIGVTIISRSNEDDPLLIAKLVGFEFVSKNKNPCPIIEENGKKLITMGILVPYNEDLLLKMKPMTPKEQWDYMVEQKLGLRWE